MHRRSQHKYPPLVSVIIPCRNERNFVAQCVRALLDGTEPNIEVLVADGQSDDGSREILETIAATDDRLILIANPARSTPVALNAGVMRAKGEYVSILGAHSEPAPDWIERNLDALSRNPSAVGVGGVLETVGSSFLGGAVAAVLRSPFGVGNARFRTGGRGGEVDTIVFGCYRRRAFSYGFFDIELTTNQDDEFNTRLIARGERLVFDTSIQCRYYSRSSWDGVVRQYWKYGLNKPCVYMKAGRLGSLRQLVPAAWVAFLAAVPICMCKPMLAYAAWAALVLYIAAGAISAAKSKCVTRLGRLMFLPVAASVHLAYGSGMWYGVFRNFAQHAGIGGGRRA